MNFLRKQGVAWALTFVMIAAAIGIGVAKARVSASHPSSPDSFSDGSDSWYVYDDAGVLSDSTERALRERNQQLDDAVGAVVACVTTNYGRDDLYDFALDYAQTIGLKEHDFIVVLDISGENYWLVQGSGLVDLFTDDDCSTYAWKCMEDDFAAGHYGDALLSLTQALAGWYSNHDLT